MKVWLSKFVVELGVFTACMAICENPFDYTDAIVNAKGNKVSLHCQTYTSTLSYDDGIMSN